MLGEGKEKSRGVAVVDLLRPDGFCCFSMGFAKMRGKLFFVYVVPL